VAQTRDVVVVVAAVVVAVGVWCVSASAKGRRWVIIQNTKSQAVRVPCRSPRLAIPSAQQEDMEKGANFMLAWLLLLCLCWVVWSVGERKWWSH